MRRSMLFGGDSPSIQAIFNASYVSAASSSSYTFNGCAIGAESGRKLVVVVVSGQSGNNRSISSVTIGGVAAVAAVKNDNTFVPSAIYTASVTGTSATVVVTFSGSLNDCGIGVYSLYSGGAVSVFASNKAANTGGGISGLSANVNVPQGGAVIAYASDRSSAGKIYTWTGVTKNFDEDVSINNGHSGGVSLTPTVQTPRPISYTVSTTANAASIVSASWAAT